MDNVGEDPLLTAEKYPTLHVIGNSLESGRVRACQDLAEHGTAEGERLSASTGLG